MKEFNYELHKAGVPFEAKVRYHSAWIWVDVDVVENPLGDRNYPYLAITKACKEAPSMAFLIGEDGRGGFGDILIEIGMKTKVKYVNVYYCPACIKGEEDHYIFGKAYDTIEEAEAESVEYVKKFDVYWFNGTMQVEVYEGLKNRYVYLNS